MEELDWAVSRFVEFFKQSPDNDYFAMHGTLAAMHSLCASLAAITPSDRNSEKAKQLLEPAIKIHEESPFVRRLRDWPRGYPGDFETVELLVAAQPSLSSGERGYWIDWYALNTAIAQQHRNKINWQYLQMSGGPPKRILSIGCGGGADFNISPSSFLDYQVVLLDMDEAALELAECRLAPYAIVDVVKGDAVRGLKNALDRGPFDLVVCGGLFDYLPSNAIGFILKTISAYGLKSCGKIIFTNIADANPYQIWMESIANWHLLHRTRQEIVKLASDAGFAHDGIEITRDLTGLTHLVSLKSYRDVLANKPKSA
jgi:SAM-dependent methyltransferase